MEFEVVNSGIGPSSMISRVLLSLILTIAGSLHLLRPELFDSAIPFGYRWPINILAGLLELGLVLGLLNRKLQNKSAQIIALWFLILIPIHVYVSWNHIEMFGMTSPILLWIRTILQPVLYFWALSLQTTGWMMAQTWRDVLFLHYEVDPKLLQSQVPFKLDLYQGQAIVSVVSFTMDAIRFPYLPAIPGLSKLNELNLRTYVEVDGVKGVYFFTLDADLRPAIWIARIFFSLPYCFSKINIKKTEKTYSCESKNGRTSLRLEAKIGAARKSDHFDKWATERYGLFTQRSQNSIHGIVEHIPWQLKDVAINRIEDNFSSQLGMNLKAKYFFAQGYCTELKVRFRPFYKIKPIKSPIQPT